jgi:hypothetical protein
MASLQDLIASKDYPKALQRLQAELQRNPRDPRLRLRYADVLLLADKQREGVKELLDIADAHAADGFTAKAIALLKRVEKLEPRRADIKSRLKNLVQQKVSQAPSPPSPSGGGFQFGMEEFDPSEEISIGGPPVSVAAPEPVPVPEFEPELIPEPEPEPEPLAIEPEPLAIEPEPLAIEPEPLAITADPEPVPLDSDMEGLDFVDIDPEPPPPAEEPGSFLSSPLFEGLSEDELMAVIQGLNFESFASGDIVVAEGAPGASMYILTTGRVKAFVKDREGHYRLVKELGEGDFFGEVSVLTGRPRTATITAAADCEVLELDRPTLEAITARFPRVHAVLKKFHEKRAQATVEALLKKD